MNKMLLVPLSLASDEQPVWEKAGEVAQTQGYDVLLLHVIDLYQVEIAMAGAELKVDDLDAYREHLIAEKRREAQARLQEIAAELQARGLAVAIDIESGRPGRTIIRTVNHRDEISRVVMGSRHGSALERGFRRNIAAKVQRKAPCPVTVVQLPAR